MILQWLASVPEDVRGSFCAGACFVALFCAYFALNISARREAMEKKISAALQSPGDVHALPAGALNHLLETGRIIMQDVIK